VLRRPSEPARITGQVRSSTHFSGYRVNQDLSGSLPVLSYTLWNVTLRGQIDDRRDAFFRGL
jgi:hypothetical protein